MIHKHGNSRTSCDQAPGVIQLSFDFIHGNPFFNQSKNLAATGGIRSQGFNLLSLMIVTNDLISAMPSL